MSSNKTIVIVPGAWHKSHFFEQTASHLQAAGYNCSPIDLASVGASPPVTSFQPDVELIKQAITRAADAGHDITVIGHSYGSVPACAAIQNLDKKSRAAANLPGGVTQKIFLCSFLLPAGLTPLQGLSGPPPTWLEVSPDGTQAVCTNPSWAFYNDLPKQEQDKWAATLLPHSFQVFSSPLTYEAWRDVPSSYIYCTLDNAIPIADQKRMVEETAKGVDIRTVQLESSHSPFLSMPETLARTIGELIEGRN